MTKKKAENWSQTRKRFDLLEQQRQTLDVVKVGPHVQSALTSNLD